RDHMSEVTVRSLAKVLGMPVEKLLEQLAGAGMTFSGPDQVVSSTEKMKLLGFLRRTHGKDEKPGEAAVPKKITLQRRKQEELTVNAGKSKSTVTVEVRQKRTYVKRDDVDAGVDEERAEALRKLEESKARSHREKPAPAPRATARDAGKPGARHKARGSHAMVDNEGDEGTGRFVAGQLHLSDSERARRGAAGARK